MSHSLLKPQRLLIDKDDYYIAIDLLTNTYYICYRDVMMIDVDRYKNKDIGVDTLDEIKYKLANYPEFFFRIFSSRNGYHIFVINKSLDYKSEESIKLMYDLNCDFYYIVYSYLRGWSVRFNKKKGEENIDNLYLWIGDVVKGIFFPSDLMLFSEKDNILSSEDKDNIINSKEKDKIINSEEIKNLSIDKIINSEEKDNLLSPEETKNVSIDKDNVINSKDNIINGKELQYEVNDGIQAIMPDPRLEALVDLHIELTQIFKNVGLCSMPAPTTNVK